jgi:hypothetical protein
MNEIEYSDRRMSPDKCGTISLEFNFTTLRQNPFDQLRFLRRPDQPLVQAEIRETGAVRVEAELIA